MKTPFNEDDYFAGSTMSFGDHLEELRRVLINSLYGLGIAMLLGMLLARPVVIFFKGPIEKALQKYEREQKREEYVKKEGAEIPVEMLHLMQSQDLVPDFFQLEPGELIHALKLSYPDADLKISAYTFVPADFEVEGERLVWYGSVGQLQKTTVELAARLVREGEAKAASPGKVLYELLTAEQQATVRNLSKMTEEQVSLGDRRALAAVLSSTLSRTELLNDESWKQVVGKPPADATIKLLREQHAKSPLDDEQTRRLNKLVISSYFHEQIRPSQSTLIEVPYWKSGARRVQALNAQEAFMIWMQASFMTGLVLSSPWIFYQLWLFVAAGLYPHEKNYVYLYLPVSLILFLAGAGLAFAFVFEQVLDFLFYFNKWMEIDPDPRVGEWLGFVLILPLAFGGSFQLPLVMLFINRIGVVSISMYLEHWRTAILIIAVVAMVLTPGGDPYSLLLMMIPLIGLYFLGIGLCKWAPQGRNPFVEAYEP